MLLGHQVAQRRRRQIHIMFPVEIVMGLAAVTAIMEWLRG